MVTERLASPSVVGLPILTQIAQVAQNGQPAFGGAIAIADVADGLVQCGSMDRLECFAPPQAVGALSAQWASRAPGGPVVRVHPETALGVGIDALGLTAWHNPDYCVAPYSARWNAARRPFPVTSMFHNLSSAQWVTDRWLPLLQYAQPYDAMVITSRVAEQAMRDLVDNVAEQFNAAHGAHLRYAGRTAVIPYGLDLETFKPRDKAAVRAHVGLPLDALVVMYLGRFSPGDKMDLLPLLRVFQRLARRTFDREVVFALAGSEYQMLPFIPAIEAMIRNLGIESRVRILSPCPPAERHLFFAAADIFVSPTDNVQETFGLTPIEAMACGVPQVVSDFDGYRETVVHGETGFRAASCWTDCDEDLTVVCQTPTFVVGNMVQHFAMAQSVAIDLDAYEEYLELLLRNHDLRARMGEASRRRATELYGWPVVVRQFEALWTELGAIAAKTPLPPLDQRPDCYRMPYFRVFERYATRTLGPEVSVRLTDAGRGVLDGAEPLPSHYPGLEDLIFDRKALVTTLAATAAPGATLGTLAQALVDAGLHRAAARRHVMWLVKQGLASVPREG